MNTLEDLIEYMKEKKVNPLIVDAWEDNNKEVYNLMKKLYDDKDTREVIFGNFKIKIDYTIANYNGRDTEPAEYRTTVLVNFGA